MPFTLRARRNGSASSLLRTRIATSRGRKPCAQPLVDHRRDAVGLGRAGVEVDVAHRRRRRALRRAQPLVDARHDLEPIGVVVGDEARGGVEDRLGRAVVLGEHHLAAAGVELAEREQVRGRRAAPAVDGLVVVADHGDVAALCAGQQPHQLELRVVRVLELVDQDVAVARAQLGQRAPGARAGASGCGGSGRRSRRRRPRPAAPGRPRRTPPARGCSRGLVASPPASAAAASCASAQARYAAGETSSSLARLTNVSSASRWRVGSPSGRKRCERQAEQALAQEDDLLGLA